MELPLALRASLHEGQQGNGGVRNPLSLSTASRPSMMIQQPDYYASMADFDATEAGLSDSDENDEDGDRYNDASSYDDTDDFDESVNYSASDDGDEGYDNFDSTMEEEEEEEDFSFADGSESNDGKISPEEARKREKERKRKIGSLEHQRVTRARVFVLLLLICTAVSNAVIVYYLNKNNEFDDYYFHFNQLALEIMQGTQESVRVAFQAMDAMSIALTTRIKDDPDGTGDIWPMVTFSDFALLSEEVRQVTGAVQIVLVPIVYEELRLPWEEYTVQNKEWLREEDPIEYTRYRRLLSQASNHTTEMPLFLEDNEDNGETDAREGYVSSLPPQQQSSSSSLRDSSLRYPPQPQSTAQHIQQLPREEGQQRQRRQQYVESEHNLRGPTPARIHPAPTREQRLVPGMQYAPVWQMSPVPYYRGIVNHDMYRERSFHGLSHEVHNTRRAVISPQLKNPLVDLLLDEHYPWVNPSDNFSPPEDEDENTNNNNNANIFTSSNPELNNQKYPPTSVMVQPVWDTLSPTAELAGYLIALIPWEAYLVDTFRSNTDEAALARYECEEASQEDSDDIAIRYNYKVYGGGNVTYVGPGQNFNGDDEFDFSTNQKLDFPLEPPPKEFAEALEQFLPYNASGQLDSEENHSPRLSGCDIQLVLYPTEELRNIYITDWPIYYALMVCAVFFVLTLVFFFYNCFVERRRGRAMAVAEKTNRIVNNLFPSHFADQLISEDKKKEKEAAKNEKKKKKKKKVVIEEAPTRQLKKFMKENKSSNNMDTTTSERGGGGGGGEGNSPLFLAESKPIADLFPETTVLFADIAGFTAWSSVREPSQVFTLLETVYQSFDALAKQYGIFKIETIGDCYVAVCGLPEPRADHAVAMARFSLACMSKMQVLVSQLERTLGPDTGDLTIRTGLHSGPVTAGVLRGERARFQLFGDTVNTAARMESTGLRDKIQISQDTADLLLAAGKTHWFVQRDEIVSAKGKGEMQTYWLQSSVVNRRQSMGGPTARRQSMGPGGPSRGMSVRRGSMGDGSAKVPPSSTDAAQGRVNGAASADSGSLSSKKHIPVELTKKQQRLVDWNCDMLKKLIRQIVARRNFLKNATKPMPSFTAMMQDLPKLGGVGAVAQKPNQQGKATPLEEVVEVIPLPEFDVAAYHGSTDAKNVRLDPAVLDQLERFVSILASKYNDNPFHCFEHASHVAMSVSKLLNRIVAPDLESINDRRDNNDMSSTLHLKSDMKDLHDHTYGITSDPLTQLAVVLSALIHDVDHRGVPNNILCEEEPELGAKYNKKSVAEQRSIDVSWEIFMDDSLKDLRETLCPEPAEMKRFRQIIVNSVMATDIFDPHLSALRKARWVKAFEVNKEVGAEVEPFDKRRSSQGLAAAAKRPSFLMPSAVKDNGIAQDEINRKATIVIEHLIQASDVAHTMQHWHIYQKWNECLFKEMYQAYKKGRSKMDPSENWYKGELWFFDNYVIPLANKLKECGVFGVSSDEYLDYATANRSEWETKGQEIVANMLEKYGDVVTKEVLGYE